MNCAIVKETNQTPFSQKDTHFIYKSISINKSEIVLQTQKISTVAKKKTNFTTRLRINVIELFDAGALSFVDG